MVAFFRYSPIDILSVHLPPSVLEFNGHFQPDWIRKEAIEVLFRSLSCYFLRKIFLTDYCCYFIF